MSYNIVKTLLLLVALQDVAQLADGQACGGTFTDQSGTFASPNFPADYPTNADCIYTIEAASGKVVKLTFTSFSVEYWSTDCSYDFVQVIDTDDNQIGKFCGLKADDIVSSGNVMVVKFKSDNMVQGMGFQASYSTYELASDANDCSPNPCQNGGTCTDQVFTYDCACAAGYAGQNCQGPNVCNGTFAAVSGTLYSPGYPGYPNNANCTYTVQVAAGSRVQLNIAYGIEAWGPTWGCIFDWLSVYDGTSSDTLLGKVCDYGEATYISTCNTVTLVFRSDEDFTHVGFEAVYATV